MLCSRSAIPPCRSRASWRCCGPMALNASSTSAPCRARGIIPSLTKLRWQPALRRNILNISTCRRWAGWRNAGFRGYADYMLTEGFQDALEQLIEMSRRQRVAIMCAEAVPWRCHRSLVADALGVHGVPVVEILSESSYRLHKLTPFAQVEGMRIIYPPEQAPLL